jgi:hypothetical protein
MVAAIHSSDQMLRLCRTVVPSLLKQQPSVRLIIVDSVIRTFRNDYPGVKDIKARQTKIRETMQLLRAIARKHKVAVLVTNDVTADMSTKTGSGGGGGGGSFGSGFSKSSDAFKPMGGAAIKDACVLRLCVSRKRQSAAGNFLMQVVHTASHEMMGADDDGEAVYQILGDLGVWCEDDDANDARAASILEEASLAAEGREEENRVEASRVQARRVQASRVARQKTSSSGGSSAGNGDVEAVVDTVVAAARALDTVSTSCGEGAVAVGATVEQMEHGPGDNADDVGGGVGSAGGAASERRTEGDARAATGIVTVGGAQSGDKGTVGKDIEEENGGEEGEEGEEGDSRGQGRSNTGRRATASSAKKATSTEQRKKRPRSGSNGSGSGSSGSSGKNGSKSGRNRRGRGGSGGVERSLESSGLASSSSTVSSTVDVWSCVGCTFANPLAVRACTICGKNKPTRREAAQAAAKAAANA